MVSGPSPYQPLGLLAELTHRCPLRCPYCSNPLDLERRSHEIDTATWLRVFREAADMGVLQVHLSGGEPTARPDIVELTRGASESGLYTNLITSGIGVTRERLDELAAAGLDHVQLSVQDVEQASADRIAGLAGAFARKRALAEHIRSTGLAFTINVVIHRHNIARVGRLIDDAVALGAQRIEVAHAQLYGWAMRNRAALMPKREDALAARDIILAARERLAGKVGIDYVPPDYLGRYPKPCMNGWARRSLNVTPNGRVLPCHAAESIQGLVFWSVAEHSLADIWAQSPAFEAFRGTDWMREPCVSCPRREIDLGGCRCQAAALTGDARNTDPVCHLSPHRGIVDAMTTEHGDSFAYRGYALAMGDVPPGVA